MRAFTAIRILQRCLFQLKPRASDDATIDLDVETIGSTAKCFGIEVIDVLAIADAEGRAGVGRLRICRGRRRGSIKTAWRLACKRAKIAGLQHFHDLRREAGSRSMEAGVPLATIQRWLGHHKVSQTSTYLAATGGADAMRLFEPATGRLREATSNRTAPASAHQSSEAAQSAAMIH
jgi:hypothetical protein